jgi:ABC-type nickel/cobalt efflux system permease component RcnA
VPTEIGVLLLELWGWLVAVQREISAEVARMLRAYAETGDWQALLSFLPAGIAIGAAHALTPGHSKTVLALFVAGSGLRPAEALRTAAILSNVHISMSVAIVLLSLPVVSLARGEAGRALLLEDLSRGLLGVVGVWLVISSLRTPRPHVHGGTAFGVAAGLIPCPLTLFIMTFAAARGVPEAGLAFAGMMLVGVALVLGTVATVASLTRAGFEAPLAAYGSALSLSARIMLGLTGAALIFVVAAQLL